MGNITARITVYVSAPPERVWDFTQDWSQRHEWDATVLQAVRDPGSADDAPAFQVRGAAGLGFVAKYKLYERPRKTSLVMTDITSRLVTGGGGSWSYEAANGGTSWTQTNTLTLRGGLIGALLRPFVRWQLARSTRKAMEAAKRRIEQRP
jgi:hypothetical protein